MKSNLINSSKSIEAYPLIWDTNFFGIEAARVNILGNLNEEEEVAILDFCNNYEFSTIANNGNNNKVNLWLNLKTTAFLTDINMQFGKKIHKSVELIDKTFTIKNNLAFNEDILNIAKNSFNFSRFFNDPYLPKEKKENIYTQWVTSAFNQKNKFFAYQEKNNEITGFLLFSLNSKYKEVHIELIAVNNHYKGEGIGKNLIRRLEGYTKEKKYEIIKVGTQITNIEAINFYSSCGFKYISSNSIFHFWHS